MRSLRLPSLLILLTVLMLNASASASPFDPTIDFRSGGAFIPGSGVDTHTVSSHGIDITLDAMRDDGTGYVSAGSLYWDSTDGYGVKGVSYEYDEIENPEVLRMSFSTTVIVERILITDLFIEGSPSYVETGSYSVDGGASWHAILADGLHANGEVELDMLDVWADEILFTAPGRLGGESHEFSVGGIDLSVPGGGGGSNPIPEPSAALLFAVGGLAIGRRLGRAAERGL
jgi:hypothetical protein